MEARGAEKAEQAQKSILGTVLARTMAVSREEMQALGWAFSYFFALLCSYYIIRPMRDEMGIAGGVERLQWLFSGTFLAMLMVVPLFGWITRRYTTRRFLPFVYYFFIGNLLVFFALFKSDITHAYVARAFFIWVSVFNLFIVSVFWSFMADTFTNEQAKRLFGVIAAGGTAGALSGPLLTAVLVVHIGPANLLPLAAAILGWAVLCIHRLIAWKRSTSAFALRPDGANPSATSRSNPENRLDEAMGGSIFAGVKLVFQSSYLAGICLLILFYASLATFLYFHQAQIVKESFDDAATRTAVFAVMDFSVNALTLAVQIFITGRLIRKIGVGWTLALIPMLLVLGFLALGAAPVLGVIVVVQVLRRAGNYAVMRPAREMLYVVLGREEKYKAKNFIDTVVYRGGDAVSAWFYTALQSLGLSASLIALMAAPLAAIWSWISFWLGRRQEQMAEITSSDKDSSATEGGYHE